MTQNRKLCLSAHRHLPRTLQYYTKLNTKAQLLPPTSCQQLIETILAVIIRIIIPPNHVMSSCCNTMTSHGLAEQLGSVTLSSDSFRLSFCKRGAGMQD